MVKMQKFVAVPRMSVWCSIPKLAREPDVRGGDHGHLGALIEENIMDQQTGHVLNADMEFYKLAGIGDVGEIVVLC